jgi:hypothetical protein
MRSVAPGLTMYLPKSVWGDRESLQFNKYPRGTYYWPAPKVGELPLLRVDLPTGGYRALEDLIIIAEEVRFSGPYMASFLPEVNFRTDDVARIEGAVGELWQNPKYTPEGGSRAN